MSKKNNADCQTCFGIDFADANYCEIAAQNGHVDCLEYAHQNGADLTMFVCIISIERGHLDCLEYSHKNGGVMIDYACEFAAKCGRLDCLKYIFENGGSLDNSCHWAARYGHVDCLKFAHEQGATMNKSVYDDGSKMPNVCVISLESQNWPCLKYALDNGCKFPKKIIGADRRPSVVFPTHQSDTVFDFINDDRFLPTVDFLDMKSETLSAPPAPTFDLSSFILDANAVDSNFGDDLTNTENTPSLK